MSAQDTYTPEDIPKIYMPVTVANHSGPQSLSAELFSFQWQDVEYTRGFADGMPPQRSPLLSNFYHIHGRTAVQAFVDQHPSLIGLAAEASFAIRRYFGSDQRITLELVNDPESEEDEQDLVAYIETSLPVREAMELLRRVDREWTLNHLDETRGLFSINLSMQ